MKESVLNNITTFKPVCAFFEWCNGKKGYIVRYFYKHTLEKYYENLAQAAITKTPRRKKTQVSFSKLPDIFTSDDVMLAYGYDSTGSVCSRLKRLQDNGLAQRITKGENKGKYHKLA